MSSISAADILIPFGASVLVVIAVSLSIGAKSNAAPSQPRTGERQRVGIMSDSLYELEGRFSHPRRLPLLEGEGGHYEAVDLLEIRRAATRLAWMRLEVAFANGHSCSIEGEAIQVGKILQFQDREKGPNGKCRLRMWRDGDVIRWSDRNATCIHYCGARGSLRSGSIPYSSRSGSMRR
jgi:hypothetical protein